MKYRALTSGEEIKRGDEHCFNGNWSPVSGAIGAKYRPESHVEIRRPIAEDNWIAFADRMPTKEDAYSGKGSIGRDGKYLPADGRILVMQMDGDISYSHFSGADYNSTHWMAINFVPREALRIKVDGHEVIPKANGDLHVGCQTVSSKDFDEIVRQRKAAMG